MKHVYIDKNFHGQTISNVNIDNSNLPSNGGGGGITTDFTSIYLKFDESNGATSFADSSSHSHALTSAGTGFFASNSQSISGLTSLLVSMAGVGNYIDVAPNENLKLGSEDFTFELWVAWGVINNTYFSPVFWANRDVSNSDLVFAFYNNTLVFYTNSSATASFPFSPSIDTWYHIAYTREGNNLRCFVDGVQVGTTVNFTDTILDRSLPIRILNDSYNTTDFNGFIDEMRLLKGKALYTSNFTVPTAPLGLYTESS